MSNCPVTCFVDASPECLSELPRCLTPPSNKTHSYYISKHINDLTPPSTTLFNSGAGFAQSRLGAAPVRQHRFQKRERKRERERERERDGEILKLRQRLGLQLRPRRRHKPQDARPSPSPRPRRKPARTQTKRLRQGVAGPPRAYAGGRGRHGLARGRGRLPGTAKKQRTHHNDCNTQSFKRYATQTNNTEYMQNKHKPNLYC